MLLLAVFEEFQLKFLASAEKQTRNLLELHVLLCKCRINEYHTYHSNVCILNYAFDIWIKFRVLDALEFFRIKRHTQHRSLFRHIHIRRQFQFLFCRLLKGKMKERFLCILDKLSMMWSFFIIYHYSNITLYHFCSIKFIYIDSFYL